MHNIVKLFAYRRKMYYLCGRIEVFHIFSLINKCLPLGLFTAFREAFS